MKKSEKNILYLTILVLIIMVAILIGIIINFSNDNKIEDNEKLKKQQLEETTTNNSYIALSTHLLEIENKEPTIYTFTQSETSNGMTFDISSVEGYENLVLYKNIFPVVTAAYATHTGATQGWNISYDSSTGKITIVKDNTNNIAKASRGTCYVLVW